MSARVFLLDVARETKKAGFGVASAEVFPESPDPLPAPPSTSEELRLRLVEVALIACTRLRALGDEFGARPLEALAMKLQDEYRLVRRAPKETNK